MAPSLLCKSQRDDSPNGSQRQCRITVSPWARHILPDAPTPTAQRSQSSEAFAELEATLAVGESAIKF